ncbi:DUF2252 domain-containing protein [Intrasporangium sp.]|uniref:DUF2252 domain-containing protein n=1 Tax=Intrasporangium sp. TaxID=1925024 RepID=UPI0032213CC6
MSAVPEQRPLAAVGFVDREEQKAQGRAARATLPLEAHAELRPVPGQDPVAILEGQATTRVPELVPVRYGRMLVDAFTFYRGAAAVMADDLGHVPHSGLTVQLCGDAHVSNFGLFASPERRLVFDVNDFDETWPGPFEWDVKRLAASLEIAGRTNGHAAKERRRVVLAAAQAYREGMREYARQPMLEVWYRHGEVDATLDSLRGTISKESYTATRKAAAKARGRTSEQALGKLTTTVDGVARFRSEPPLLVPLRELAPNRADRMTAWVTELLQRYQQGLRSDLRHLLGGFRLVDIARKVVGVGSVGTRAWVGLLVDDTGHPLMLQAKEAVSSVLEPYAAEPPTEHHGRRVVEGQRLMQSSSDILLGWQHVRQDITAEPTDTDYYVRQFRDWKGSFVVESLGPRSLRELGAACGRTLARAHARSGHRIAIASYLGSKETFEQAVGEFAVAYADKTERDYAALEGAVAAGRLVAAAVG